MSLEFPREREYLADRGSAIIRPSVFCSGGRSHGRCGHSD